MKPGDLVKLAYNHQYVNLYEDDYTGSIVGGDRFHRGEVGVVLEVFYTRHKILTPRSTTGWIQRHHLEIVSCVDGGK